jgi:hypothetical protein
MPIHPKDLHAKFKRQVKTGRLTVEYFQEPEDVLQRKCEKYLENKRLTFIHVPDLLFKFLFGKSLANYIKSQYILYSTLQNVRRQISKYFLGFPDLVIFSGTKYLAVELKKKKGGKVSQGQRNYHELIPVTVIKDFPTFRRTVDEWESNLTEET